MTPRFSTKYCDEVVIWALKALTTSGKTLEGGLAQLRTDLNALEFEVQRTYRAAGITKRAFTLSLVAV